MVFASERVADARDSLDRWGAGTEGLTEGGLTDESCPSGAGCVIRRAGEGDGVAPVLHYGRPLYHRQVPAGRRASTRCHHPSAERRGPRKEVQSLAAERRSRPLHRENGGEGEVVDPGGTELEESRRGLHSRSGPLHHLAAVERTSRGGVVGVAAVGGVDGVGAGWERGSGAGGLVGAAHQAESLAPAASDGGAVGREGDRAPAVGGADRGGEGDRLAVGGGVGGRRQDGGGRRRQGDGQAVVSSTGDGARGTEVDHTTAARDIGRAVAAGAVSELAEYVAPPGPHRPGGIEGEAGAVLPSDPDDLAEAGLGHRRGAARQRPAQLGSGVGAYPELAVAVVSPGSQRLVAHDREAVEAPGGDTAGGYRRSARESAAAGVAEGRRSAADKAHASRPQIR